ncbi:Fe-S cluster assembly protein IscX [Shewanella youngdeokensis]|uniref:Fe-S cluster assembly protein IscX n=1 Tax=Shewanella youngdeokensis TaxID=2999068 RepID=A0ABZ0K1I4_9GAMM|nr:Fe-S cluster assembly protein IscX [Shewanella sp. DAU334]
MELKWTDSQDIALELLEKYPDVNPEFVRFTELFDSVVKLAAFDDDPKQFNEAYLEAILGCWIDEK